MRIDSKENKYLLQKTSYTDSMFFYQSSSQNNYCDISIVIPVCNEFPTFFDTLDSLYESYSYSQQQDNEQVNKLVFSIVIIINNRIDSNQNVKLNNQKLLQCFSYKENNQKYQNKNFTISVLNCTKESESTKTVFSSQDGVGLARKIGMDFSLLQQAKVIACMDADTYVEPNYYGELARFYLKNKDSVMFGLTSFTHQKNEDNKTQKNIDAYEQWMKTHSKNLFEAGTPFYPVALGPTIICTKEAYIQSGGMNKKLAGEDFYFLQMLIKLLVQKNDYIKENQLFEKLNTTVFPSSRLSDRVLFGTGKTLATQNDFEENSNQHSYRVFPIEYYKILKSFIDLFNSKNENVFCLDDFMSEIKIQIPLVNGFLVIDDFWKKFSVIISNCKKTKESRRIAFLCYFDGLKIIRLFHYFDEVKQL